MNNKNYYNISDLLSHDAMFSFCLGSRGAGKTWQGKKRMVDLFLKKKKQSAYVRRTNAELKAVKNTVFNDIALEYPNLEITIKGDTALINGEVFCYFLALSTSPKYKSSSYPNVDFMFFDEYILTPTGYTHYLPNEMNLLLDLSSTIFRKRTPKIYICSNAVSYSNPFFEYFGVTEKFKHRFLKFYSDDNTIDCVIEFTGLEEYINDVKQTRFGKFMMQSAYGSYAIENDTLYDTSDFIISERPYGFDFCFAKFLMSNNKEIFMWIKNDFDYYYYFSEEGANGVIQNISLNGYKENYFTMKALMSNPKGKRLKDSIIENRVTYSNTHVKNYVLNEIMPKLKREY